MEGEFIYPKILTILLFFLLWGTIFVLPSSMQDPVISLICPYLKEGKNLDEAIEILKKDWQNRPWNHDVRLYLGIAYFMKQERELAFQQLKKIEEQLERMMGGDRPFGDELLFIYHKMQRKDRGVFSRENLGLFYFAQGLLLKLKGQSKEAEKRFKSALKAGYKELDVRFQLLDLYIRTKDYKATQKELNALSKLSPEDKNILFLKGYLQYQSDKPKEAKSYFEKVLSLNPDFLPAKKNLALLEYNYGNYLTAIGILQEITQQYPSDKEAHINLGRAYFRNGEIEKAKEEFKLAGISIEVQKYSPVKIPLLTLPLTTDIKFNLTCGE